MFKSAKNKEKESEYNPIKPSKELKFYHIYEWTTEEIEKLFELKANQSKWEEISKILKRSVAACQTKYYATVKSDYLSNKEMRHLLDLVATIGEDWEQISKNLKKPRNICILVYRRFLKELYSDPWTEQQEERLKTLYFENTRISSSMISFNPKEKRKKRKKRKTLIENENENETEFQSETENETETEIENGDFLVTYAKQFPVNWRNISHFMRRSSYDCRLQFLSSYMGFDMGKLSDVWYEGESKYLHIAVKNGNSWSSIARDLGRTVSQCYNCYHGTYFPGHSELVPQLPHINEAKTQLLLEASRKNLTLEMDLMDQLGKNRIRAWSNEEDLALLGFFKEFPGKWKIIGEKLNRPNNQCFQRYQILKCKQNGMKKGWTPEEYDELYKLVQEYQYPNKSPPWTLIGKKLNRTSYVCREAYKRLLDKMEKQLKIELPMPKRKLKNSNRNKIYFESDTENNQDLIHQNDEINARNNSDIDLADRMSMANESLRMFDPRDEDLSQTRGNAWTKQEDKRLKLLVSTYGRKWTVIAEGMRKSPEDVMLRYDFKIAKSHKKPGSARFDPKNPNSGEIEVRSGLWSRDEDEQLLNLYAIYGSRWSLISGILGTRTGIQCALRYRQSLDPRLKWRLWRPDEDEQLICLRDETGYSWAMISAILDRAMPSCRYRYLKLKKQKQIQDRKRLNDEE